MEEKWFQERLYTLRGIDIPRPQLRLQEVADQPIEGDEMMGSFCPVVAVVVRLFLVAVSVPSQADPLDQCLVHLLELVDALLRNPHPEARERGLGAPPFLSQLDGRRGLGQQIGGGIHRIAGDNLEDQLHQEGMVLMRAVAPLIWDRDMLLQELGEAERIKELAHQHHHCVRREIATGM